MEKRNPLLNGEMYDAACAKIDEIAAALSAQEMFVSTAGLPAGNLGVALFLHYYDLYTGERRYTEVVSKAVLTEVAEIGSDDNYAYRGDDGLQLGSDIGDLGWVIRQVSTASDVYGQLGKMFEGYETQLYRQMSNEVRLRPYDFLSRMPGLALYCIHGTGNFQEACMKQAALRLYEQWETSPNASGSSERFGFLNVLKLLRRIDQSHPGIETVPRQIEIVFSRLFDGFKSDERNAGSSGYPADEYYRWMDALAVLCAVAAENRNAEQVATIREWGERLTSTRLEECVGVLDAGLSDGISGLGHIYGKLYRYTDSPVFGDAARFCFSKVLDEATQTIGEGGSGRFWLTESNGMWGVHPGFLRGTAGIGLALMAAVSEGQPCWDEYLLSC